MENELCQIKKPITESWGRVSIIPDLCKREAGEEVSDYITEVLNLRSVRRINTACMPSTLNVFPEKYALEGTRALIDFKLLNHTRYINKYLKRINSLIPEGAIYFARFESQSQRDKRFFNGKRGFISRIEKFLDFFVHRVIPRLKRVNKIYFAITKGKYRVISTAEALGRLVSCGFEIIEHKLIGPYTYVVAMKTRLPLENIEPTYGPFVRLNRVGKGGKLIKVYKFRTMHPFSEFIQDYVIKLNGYNEVGKPANDFRVTRWGKLFRKYWIDEMPQLINVLRGEMKLVGVRPLSQVRYNELTKFVKNERIRERPGCIPPYVSLNMPSSDANIKAEMIYILEKAIRENRVNKSMVNLEYFYRAIYNIFSNRIVSA